jgi:hypothetical protein
VAIYFRSMPPIMMDRDTPDAVDENGTPKRYCSKCGEEKLLTTEFFSRDKNRADGFRSDCKACNRAYRAANRERTAEYNRAWYRANPEYHRVYYEANRAHIIKYNCQRNKTSKVRIAARAWKQANKVRIAERKRAHYRANLEHYRAYYEANREQISERRRALYRANPDKVRMRDQRRRARKKALPASYTEADWIYVLDYFNHCCAVCGRQLKDLFGTHTAAMDHWIPLTATNCPGTIPENIVPLCHGQNGCNNKKGNRNALEFLELTYGKKKAKAILKRIEDYFEVVRQKKPS